MSIFCVQRRVLSGCSPFLIKQPHQCPCSTSRVAIRYARFFGSTPFRSRDKLYPSVPACPDPTCNCAATPTLDIDQKAKLTSTAPSYDKHIVIFTGRQDWKSRIEDEGSGKKRSDLTKAKLREWIDSQGEPEPRVPGLSPGQREVGLARGLKDALRADRKWFNPTKTVMVTNSSFNPPQQQEGEPTTSALVFPDFELVKEIPDTNMGHQDFFRSHVSDSSDIQPSKAFRTAELKKPVVLVCSHAARDERCGILGPLLYSEFLRQLDNLKCGPLGNHVGMCSHVGGHKWAGNCIIYIPPIWPNWQDNISASGELPVSKLSGKGIWYGRVEPKHIEGLIKETILGGRVVEELCRGVIW